MLSYLAWARSLKTSVTRPISKNCRLPRFCDLLVLASARCSKLPVPAHPEWRLCPTLLVGQSEPGFLSGFLSAAAVTQTL